MSPKFTLSVVSRILTHTGQGSAAEKLAEVRPAFLREVGQVATSNAEGSAKRNKVSFGDAKLKDVLKSITPKEMDEAKKKEWAKFADTITGAWHLAVAVDGNVPLTEAEIAERAAKEAEAKAAKEAKAPAAPVAAK